MRVGTDKKDDRYQIIFDSWHEFLTWSKDNQRITVSGGEWSGADTVAEAADLGIKGLPADGLKALALSDKAALETYRELPSQLFEPMHAVSGAQVDIARYLEGEPECMVDYWMDSEQRPDRICTIVISMAVSGNVSAAQIRERGMHLVALLEAIEAAAYQTEVWLDMSSTTNAGGGRSWTGPIARTSVRVKAPGDGFDVAALMFAFTHPAVFRALGFNSRIAAMPRWITKGLDRCGAGGGRPEQRARDMDADYPDGAIIVPSIGAREISDIAGWCNGILTKLGLI